MTASAEQALTLRTRALKSSPADVSGLGHTRVGAPLGPPER
jgi:hypothetical protein